MSENATASTPASPMDVTPARQISIQDVETRQKVIGILSDTVNDCVPELGYHPDLLQQLQSIHDWNLRLRDENTKLFHDNRKLAHLIGTQNQKITSATNVTHAPGQPSPIVVDLQRKLHTMEMSYQDLYMQHKRAVDEITSMRDQLARLNSIMQSMNPQMREAYPPRPPKRPHQHTAPPQYLANALPNTFAPPSYYAYRQPSAGSSRDTPASSAFERPNAGYRASSASSSTEYPPPGHRIVSSTHSIDANESHSHHTPNALQPAASAENGQAVEMIDLTAEGDSDQEERPRKTPRLEEASPESDFLQECVDANFVENDDEEGSGRLWCLMCRSRHQAGAVEEAPKPFISAGLEELVQHCEREHPRGWERLKSAVQDQQNSE